MVSSMEYELNISLNISRISTENNNWILIYIFSKYRTCIFIYKIKKRSALRL